MAVDADGWGSACSSADVVNAGNGEQLVTRLLADGSYALFGTIGAASRAEVRTADGRRHAVFVSSAGATVALLTSKPTADTVTRAAGASTSQLGQRDYGLADIGHATRADRFGGMMRRVERHSDEQLLQLGCDGGEAFGIFYDRHHLALLAAVRARVGNTEVALDVTAEVFAKALEHCESFSSRGEGSAKAWLYAIARNTLIDLYRAGCAEDRARKALAMAPLVISDEQLEQLEQRLAAESAGALRALAELSHDERDAITARVLDDAEYTQIADKLSVSESVVRKRVSRGLLRMRSTLETITWPTIRSLSCGSSSSMPATAERRSAPRKPPHKRHAVSPDAARG